MGKIVNICKYLQLHQQQPVSLDQGNWANSQAQDSNTNTYEEVSSGLAAVSLQPEGSQQSNILSHDNQGYFNGQMNANLGYEENQGQQFSNPYNYQGNVGQSMEMSAYPSYDINQTSQPISDTNNYNYNANEMSVPPMSSTQFQDQQPKVRK